MTKAVKAKVKAPVGPSEESKTQRRSSKNFLGLLEDGELRPSELILDRMRNDDVDIHERIELAKALLPYELPRLQAIEAHIKQEVTFDDALRSLDDAEGMIDGTYTDITPKE